ncbi:MAG: DUF4832 domain-containing protein, partial [Polaromonas sp.]|nr:DUF4832 domain-containing protein [Polaromonas sp.]
MSHLTTLFTPRHLGRPGRHAAWAWALALLSACGGGGSDSSTTASASASASAQVSAEPKSVVALASVTPAPETPAAEPVALTSAIFSGTTEDFPNPERGFYGESGEDFVTSMDLNSVRLSSAQGQRLVLARVLLKKYRTTDLPANWLANLNTSFSKIRAEGMKVTLLFSYDFTATGRDATAAQIKRHLEQLQPVLRANADVIPFMRAGFIGAWGEWHSSKSGNSCGYNSGTTTCAKADANRLIVRDALLTNVPTTTQIGFRLPLDLQKWYPMATQQSRAGVHNDCFLAGPTDTGTYENPDARPYTQTLSTQTAFGGETCENAEIPLRNTCPDILGEGALYHLAWLNAQYAPSVLNAWKASGCYAEVSRSMGYRLQLDALGLASEAARGEALSVALDLRNIGWARLFSARPVVVTLQHRATGFTFNGSGSNLQTLPSQASVSTRLTIGLTVPADAPVGDYDVLLSAPDIFSSTAGTSTFAVRFANADNAVLAQAWNAGTA